MSDNFQKSRRVFLRTAAMGVAALPFAKVAFHTPEAHASLPKAEDGHALDYVNYGPDSDHSRFEEGARCDNCAFWSGEMEDGWGGCRHPEFTDVMVAAEGWCSVHVHSG